MKDTKIVKFSHTQEVGEKIKADVTGATSVTITPCADETGFVDIEITYEQIFSSFIMAQLINAGMMVGVERMKKALPE